MRFVTEPARKVRGAVEYDVVGLGGACAVSAARLQAQLERDGAYLGRDVD